MNNFLFYIHRDTFLRPYSNLNHHMEFFETIKDQMLEGKEAMIYSIKMMIFHKEPELFDLLDFDDDTIFQEPLLYSYYNVPRPSMKLAHILYGYIEPSLRPEMQEVATDADGVVYLPNIGYFETGLPKRKIVVHYKNNVYSFTDKEVPVEAKFIPLTYIKGTSIELCSRNNLLFRDFFKQAGSGEISFFTGDEWDKHLKNVEKAFAIVQENFPAFYEMLQETVRRIVIFKSAAQRSFASLQVNGAAFFNIKEHDDEVFIVEDITHQCGHIVYYAVAYDRKTLLAAPEDTPLKNFTGNESDTRSVLNAFYALLPYCFSNYCSKLCDDNHVFKDRQYHEFLGRFAFRMRKFTLDIKNFSSPGIFKAKGNKLFEGIKSVHQLIYDANQATLQHFDVTNQQYEFSYDRFLQANPVESGQHV
jgi:hypothetical protein